MKRKYLFPIFFLLNCMCVSAQVIALNDGGDIFRAGAMLADENYIGALDQLALIDSSALSPEQARQAAWMRCRAMIHVDSDVATDLLRDFIDKYGADPLRNKAMMLLGDYLLENSPSEAMGVYNDVNEPSLTFGELAELRYHKAYALMRMGDMDGAENLFKLAAADKDWRRPSDFYLGYIAYTRSDYARAKELFGNADRSSMPGMMADYYLAQIFYAEGDYNKSLAAAKALLQNSDVEDSYFAEATRVAGESLFQLGETKEALKLLRRYAGMTDTPARSALYIIGTSEFNSGKAKEAVEVLRKVVDTDTSDAMSQSAYLFIGQALMAQGDRDAAILAFDNALKMDFDMAVQEAAYYNYAVAKFSGARIPFGSSAATFEEFLRRYPNGKYAPEVQEYLVDGYLVDGDYMTALSSIRRMSNPGPKVLEAKQKALYALGTQSLIKGDTDSAVNYLREASGMSGYDKTTDAQVALSFGEALARKGNHREAVVQFNRYLSGAPGDDVNRPLARYDLGYSYFALKEYEKAIDNFSHFVSLKGKDSSCLPAHVQVDALNRMADSRLYTGKYADAKDIYRKAYDKQPSAGDYPLFQIGIIDGYQRNYKDKIATLSSMIEEFPTSSLVPDALLEMTEGYIQLGDNASAVSVYRRLVSEYPGTEQGRRGYLQMALTLLNSGKRNEAIEAYRDVVRLYPTSDEAGMAVDELKRIAAYDGNLPEFVSWLETVENAPRLEIGEADRLTFEEAEREWLTDANAARLEKYLIDYPGGSFRVRALGYLTDNAVEKGNHRDVVDFATEIIERYPDSSQAENALLAKGNAEYELGHGPEALATWTLLETRASSAQMLNAARIGIMRSARDSGDYMRVIAAADALLASSTIDAETRNEASFARAYSMAQTGRTVDAIAGWEQLVPYPADINGAKSAYYLAEYYFKEGNTDKARQYVESLIDSGTPHTYWLARGFILLSDIYEKEGKKFEAREYLKSLRENYPGNETDIFQMIEERLK